MSSDQPVAIISAGGSGIGLAIAQSLHALGYGLFVLDIDPHHVAEFQRVYGEGSATLTPRRSTALLAHFALGISASICW
jgi:NAD(P)-dependent dehydrogenase (short-subunit alcohol dehydrogenase family)